MRRFQHGNLGKYARWLSAVRIEWGKREATLRFVGEVSARRQTEHTQRLTLQKQSEPNDLQWHFIFLAWHEFRTPLAVILASAERITDYGRRMPTAQQQAAIGTIDNGVRRMTQMLDRV